MKNITYAIDVDTNLVISRVDDEVAWPILDYEGMLPENNYAMNYNLEKISVSSLSARNWNGLKWTKKIPVDVKNLHRRFWGFKELKKRGCKKCGSICGVPGCRVCEKNELCHKCEKLKR